MTGEPVSPEPGRRPLDQVDLAILKLLRQDARRTVTDIATRVNLSLAPVKRRIDRLERIGIIRGYTVVVDRNALQQVVEAFCHLRLAAQGTQEVVDWIRDRVPGAQEIASVTGDDDLMIRLRAEGIDHLQKIIAGLREHHLVTGTRTTVVLDTWHRHDENGMATG